MTPADSHRTRTTSGGVSLGVDVRGASAPPMPSRQPRMKLGIPIATTSLASGGFACGSVTSAQRRGSVTIAALPASIRTDVAAPRRRAFRLRTRQPSSAMSRHLRTDQRGFTTQP